MWYGIPEYLAFVAIVALVLHFVVRRWGAACVFGAILCSVLNLVHESWRADFRVNLGWAPIEILVGCILALPIVAVVGLPFAWFRSRRGSGSKRPRFN